MMEPPLLISNDGPARTRSDILGRAGRLLRDLNVGAARPQLLPLCSRTIDFLTVIAAGRCAGLPIILPNDPNPLEIGKIIADVGPDVVVLTSKDDIVGDIPGDPVIQIVLDADADGAGPALAWESSGTSSIKLFTSGTTGVPVAHSHTFAAFDKGVDIWARRLGAETKDVVVVSTVPPQHMYGFEAGVLLPLRRQNVAVFDGRPFYAADIAAAVATAGSGAVLVTTPLHLELLVREGIPLTPLHAIVSATALLPMEIATEAERQFAAPVIEIFGTTETGMIATREPVRGDIYSLRPDAEVSFTDQHMTVHRPGCGTDVVIDDIVAPDGDGFRLMGRGADLINIAGKRASLSGLAAVLRGIDGVEDGAFVLPEKGQGAPRQQRLAAFVVAPKLSVDAIRDALRGRLSAAFMPRRIVKLAEIPRTATGKTRNAMLLQSLDGGQASFEIAPDHPALAGHFPGNPVVPGVVILQQALQAAGLSPGTRFRSVKFKGVLRPAQRCTVEKSDHGEWVQLHCWSEGREIMTAEMKPVIP